MTNDFCKIIPFEISLHTFLLYKIITIGFSFQLDMITKQVNLMKLENTNLTIYFYKDQRKALLDSKKNFSKSLRKNLKFNNSMPYDFFLFKTKKVNIQHLDIYNKNDFLKANLELEPEFTNKKKYKARYTYSNIGEKSKFKKQDYLDFNKKKLISTKIVKNLTNDGDDPKENNFIKKDKLSGGLYKIELKKILKKIPNDANSSQNSSQNSPETGKPFYDEYGNSFSSINFIRNNLGSSSQEGFQGSGFRMNFNQQFNNNGGNFNNSGGGDRQNGNAGDNNETGNNNFSDNSNRSTNNNFHNLNAYRVSRFFSSVTAGGFFNALAAATAASIFGYLWVTGRNYNLVRHINRNFRNPSNSRYILQNGQNVRINGNRRFFDTTFREQRTIFNQNIIRNNLIADRFSNYPTTIRAGTPLSHNSNSRTRGLSNLMTTVYNLFPVTQELFNLIVTTMAPNFITLPPALWNFWHSFRIFLSSNYFQRRYASARTRGRNLLVRIRTFSFNLTTNTSNIITQTWLFETRINMGIYNTSEQIRETVPDFRAVLLEIRYRRAPHDSNVTSENPNVSEANEIFCRIWTESNETGLRNVLLLDHQTYQQNVNNPNNVDTIRSYTTIVSSDNVLDLWDPLSDFYYR